MAVKSDTRTIGEHTYRVTQLTALKSRALFVRLVKLLGPAVVTVIGSGVNVNRAQLGGLLSELFTRLSDDELAYFCNVLGACTEVLGPGGAVVIDSPAMIDVHFAGRLLDMFKWLRFALEVQFSDFLSAAKATLAAGSTAQGTAPSASPSASTGTFGVS
jgi:hypothetical protein